MPPLHSSSPERPNPPSASSLEISKDCFCVRPHLVVITLTESRDCGFIRPLCAGADARQVRLGYLEKIPPGAVLIPENLQHRLLSPRVQMSPDSVDDSKRLSDLIPQSIARYVRSGSEGSVFLP